MTDFNLPVPDNAPWLNLSQGGGRTTKTTKEKTH